MIGDKLSTMKTRLHDSIKAKRSLFPDSVEPKISFHKFQKFADKMNSFIILFSVLCCVLSFGSSTNASPSVVREKRQFGGRF